MSIFFDRARVVKILGRSSQIVRTGSMCSVGPE